MGMTSLRHPRLSFWSQTEGNVAQLPAALDLEYDSVTHRQCLDPNLQSIQAPHRQSIQRVQDVAGFEATLPVRCPRSARRHDDSRRLAGLW